MPDLTLAGFPEFETRWLPQLASRYGVKNVDFTPLAGISAYTLLNQKKVAGGGHLHDRPAADLDEVRRAEGAAEHVRLPARRARRSEEARHRERHELHLTLNKVSSLLTLRAMIAMNKAVALDKKPAASVAKSFLKANKLN